MKRFEMEVPVYNDRFKSVIEKIKPMLREFQHELVIIQKEENSSATSVEIRILLKKGA